MQFLNNSEVIRWCFKGITEKTLANTKNPEVLKEYQKQEKQWAYALLGKRGKGSQWSTTFCEGMVKEGLILLGRKNVRRTKQKKSTVRDKKYNPDFECDEYVYEVKGRNWTTTGTAGEKVLGSPLKYGEVPTLYAKPLQIILVGYQEYEASKGFAFGDLLHSEDQTKELRESLAFYKDQHIEYVGFTEILKHLGLGREFWIEE